MSSRDRLLPRSATTLSARTAWVSWVERSTRFTTVTGSPPSRHARALDLDLVLFMPAGSPAFKRDSSVSDPRIAMP